jgi:hypothetical protein
MATPHGNEHGKETRVTSSNLSENPTKLGLVLSTANVGMDQQSELWPLYEAITDRSDERPGRLGGDSSTGVMLPAIRYGKQPVDTRDPMYPKIQGGHRGTVVNPNDSDSEQVSDQTDSENDDPLQKSQQRSAMMSQ